ncbi:MAG: ribosome biogenesis GTPase Der [Vampirovibrio sp.]|nr:ribosome biogenesis GTPase Der [Vampirovibrio sp.]
MKQPVVAIIGRPNVGKSTLINRIVGSRQAIVDDLPGVTRDRKYYDATWNGKKFMLVDTGGIVPDSTDPIEALINRQVEIVLEEADMVVFVVDGPAGITALDDTVAGLLRKSGKPLFLAVNKIDQPEQRPLIHEFHRLGLGDPYPLSSLHGTGGVGDLLDAVVGIMPAQEAEEDADTIKVALVGRPNVGKSSILNKVSGVNRSIVSDMPGTTRDTIDAKVTIDNQSYTIIDTAGIRRKSKVDYGVELFSVDRSMRAIRQADVCIMVLDGSGLTKENADFGSIVTAQDKKIVDTVKQSGCGLVIAVNKWDTLDETAKDSASMNTYKKALFRELPHGRFAQVDFISALTGQRLHKLFGLARQASENNHRRIQTSLVNQAIMEAVMLNTPPRSKSKQLKVLYATQVKTAPPTFVLFVNDDKLLKDNYRLYIENKLRESFEFSGTPIVVSAKSRTESR